MLMTTSISSCRCALKAARPPMLRSLSLTNFRSYADHHTELDPHITVVVGPNATGKTNLLEAVFVLATTRSFRARDGELIHHGREFYRISADTAQGQLALGYQFSATGSEKRAQLDGVKRPLTQHLGSLAAVLFEPNDLMIILGSPDRRRRYLDFILTQTQPTYLSTLHRYRRVLLQRNRLLAHWQGQTTELFAWNIKLAELAADIDAARRALVGYINERAPELYRQIAGRAEQLILTYVGTVDGVDYASNFLAKLESNLSRDIGAGFTTIGPHRDDFEIAFKDSDITSVASRGEMRTVVLVLKLAELAYIKAKLERFPILLLDDVFSELDDSRRSFLINTLGDYQAIITTTDGDIARQLGASRVIYTAEPSATSKDDLGRD
jgi:DNA replication and repair protein RecF